MPTQHCPQRDRTAMPRVVNYINGRIGLQLLNPRSQPGKTSDAALSKPIRPDPDTETTPRTQR